MFWQMVQVEQKKLTSRKILWLELAIVAATAVFIPLIIYQATGSDSSGGSSNVVIITEGPVEEMIAWPGALGLGIDMASGSALGGLLIVILIATLTAQEYGWRTMQLWLSSGISRPVLLLAKFTVILLPALLLVIAPFMTGGLATAVFTQKLQGSLPLAEISWWQVALSILRTAYTLLPYAAFTFFVAIASRSTVVAIGSGLAYTMLIEGLLIQALGFVGDGWAKVGNYLPGGLANSLAALNRVTDEATNSTVMMRGDIVSGEAAVLGIALYTFFFVGLALLVFRRQDLGG